MAALSSPCIFPIRRSEAEFERLSTARYPLGSGGIPWASIGRG